MRIHLLQTGTVAIKQVQLAGSPGLHPLVKILSDRRWSAPLPIYAFLIEHPDGLIVVDTGETARVSERGYFPPWHPYYRLAVREWVQPEEELGPQLRALGFSPDDVRYVLLTHLHTDHAGGLAHFPKAEHLVSRREYNDARGLAGRVNGYLPQRWPTWFSPTLVEMQPEPFGPFSASYPVTSDGAVRLLPTPGHTPGHMSVVVSTPGLRYLLAGDVSYTQALMLAGQVDGVSTNQALARETLAQVRALCAAAPTVYLPSHDPDGLDRLTQAKVALAAA